MLKLPNNSQGPTGDQRSPLQSSSKASCPCPSALQRDQQIDAAQVLGLAGGSNGRQVAEKVLNTNICPQKDGPTNCGINGGVTTCFPDAVSTRVKETQSALPNQSSSLETRKENQVSQPRTLWQRIRKIKHIEIYAAGLVVLIMILIYVTSFMGGGGGGDQPPTNNGNQSSGAFAQQIEQNLVATLSNVQGAGHVSAMVTVEGSSRLEIAFNVDERTVTQAGPNGTSNTTTTVVKTPMVINGQPVIVKEFKPRVTGVVIVATGANDISVRLQLTRAVQALIGDNTVNIEILAGR